MLLVLAVVYVGLAVLVRLASEGMMFLPHPSSYKDDAGIVKITSANGNRISALYLPNPSAVFTILVSHGNAEDVGDGRYWLEELRNYGFSVLAYDYQGYGTSQGKPGEKVVYEDEAAAYGFLTVNLKVPPERIILLGRSVGSGPAIHLAARRPVGGLILQSPFLSAYRVLTHVPLFPFDRFPNSRDIGKVRCPVLIVHGARDTIVHPWQGRKLFDLANQPKQFLSVEGAGHNDLELVAGKRYLEAVQNFAASLPGGAASPAPR